MSTDTTPPEEKNEADLTGSTTSGLFRPTLFSPGSVWQLRESDFHLDTKELICLKLDDTCILVLFYGSNRESENLCEIWATASSQAAGILFGACHLGLERKVTDNFKRLSDDPNHPHYWARLQGWPFILVYRRGWPKAFYNGQRATQPLIDYALTLACKLDYQEQETNFYSMQASTNLEMSGPKERLPPLVRTKSGEYTVELPLRGYAAEYPVRRVTPEEVSAAEIQKPSSRVPKPIIPDPQIATSNAAIAQPIKDLPSSLASST